MTQPTKKRSIVQSILAQGERRARFRGAGFLWWMYDRVLGRVPSLPLPFRRRVVAINLVGVKGPLHVRLGTTDLRVLEEIFFEHEYDVLFDGTLRDVRTIADLGANVGLSIRLWQNRFPDARVVAVEPDAQNLAVARLNAQAGGTPADPLGGVTLVQACVVATAREVVLDRSLGEWAYRIDQSGTAAASAGTTVKGIPLTSILAQAGMDGEIDLIKCDIEGAESELFSDCAAWIGRVKQMIVEIHAPYTREQFLRDLTSNGGHFDYVSLKQFPGAEVLKLRRAT